jgi:hypothetical protein
MKKRYLNEKIESLRNSLKITKDDDDAKTTIKQINSLQKEINESN